MSNDPGDPEYLARLRRIFVDGVLLLALDPHELLACLPDFVPLADELGLTYDDGFILLDQLVEGRVVTPEAAEIAQAIDSTFDTMDGREHPDLWTEESVAGAAEWAEIRSLARTLLKELGEPLRAPTFAGVTYVQGAPHDDAP